MRYFTTFPYMAILKIAIYGKCSEIPHEDIRVGELNCIVVIGI